MRLKVGAAAFFGMLGALSSSQAWAVPSFARQMGVACSSCHFQHFPKLNAFGRNFKSSGYTMMGAQEKIEADRLSLPSVLNTSIFTKLRYQKTNGQESPGARTTNTGELQFPDEFAVMFAGRVAENIGFWLEGQGADPSAPLLASFKIPFVYTVNDVKLGVVPYTTDGLGASYGFELLNTGAVANMRGLEHGEDLSAQLYIHTNSAAEGVAFIARDELFFANVSLWSPNHLAGATGKENGAPTMGYLRVGATPTLGAWDVGVGAQLWNGEASANDESTPAVLTRYKASAWALDAQAQGDVSGMPLGVYFSYAVAKGSEAGSPENIFNAEANNRKAASIHAELSVLPGRATLGLGYRSGRTGESVYDGDNAWSVAATWQLAQNVQLQWMHSLRSGSAYNAAATNMQPGGSGDSLTTFMLSAGF